MNRRIKKLDEMPESLVKVTLAIMRKFKAPRRWGEKEAKIFWHHALLSAENANATISILTRFGEYVHRKHEADLQRAATLPPLFDALRAPVLSIMRQSQAPADWDEEDAKIICSIGLMMIQQPDATVMIAAGIDEYFTVLKDLGEFKLRSDAENN